MLRNSTHDIPVLCFLIGTIGLLATGEVLAEGRWNGSMTVGGGFLEHPIGLSEESDAGFVSQSLSLARFQFEGDYHWKLGYELDSSRFGNDTNLGSLRNGIGLEWVRQMKAGGGARPGRISAGVQVARRDYRDYYDRFDDQEAYGYLAFRHYFGPSTLLKGYAALQIKDFGNYEGESFREPHGELKLQRFFASRTTLGLATRFGQKVYYETAASGIWETTQLPSTSQVSVRLEFSQGIGQRHGLRGWAELRHNLDEYPHYVGPLIDAGGDTLGVEFDSPLLDRYAREGTDYFLAWKFLAPGQNWIEASVSRGDYDYGGLLFPSDQWQLDDPGQQREDVVYGYDLGWKRQMPEWLQRSQLKAGAGWRDRDSTVQRYAYSGWRAYGSLTWKW